MSILSYQPANPSGWDEQFHIAHAYLLAKTSDGTRGPQGLRIMYANTPDFMNCRPQTLEEFRDVVAFNQKYDKLLERVVFSRSSMTHMIGYIAPAIGITVGKILHLPGLRVTCTCVRVPVMRSHSISVTLRAERKISVEEAKAAIAAFPGAALMPAEADRDWPTPLDTSGQDTVYVGRIRDDLTDERGLTLWCCGDQVRKGAASNAVQILKLLTE